MEKDKSIQTIILRKINVFLCNNRCAHGLWGSTMPKQGPKCFMHFKNPFWTKISSFLNIHRPRMLVLLIKSPTDPYPPDRLVKIFHPGSKKSEGLIRIGISTWPRCLICFNLCHDLPSGPNLFCMGALAGFSSTVPSLNCFGLGTSSRSSLLSQKSACTLSGFWLQGPSCTCKFLTW